MSTDVISKPPLQKNIAMSQADNKPVIPRNFLISFILVTSLFSLWGFANDVTNPLVAVFRDVFVISNAQSTWVQMAFYGGYATMALPAAIFIRRFSYKSGIIVGLSLYALGALLSIPAAAAANFNLFIIALYILTFGLALDGVGEDAKLGSAGLIFAIVGGVFMTRFQGQILDMDGFMGTTATRGSFFLVVLCFIIIAVYGYASDHFNKNRLAA
jgi:fucose permease